MQRARREREWWACRVQAYDRLQATLRQIAFDCREESGGLPKEIADNCGEGKTFNVALYTAAVEVRHIGEVARAALQPERTP